MSRVIATIRRKGRETIVLHPIPCDRLQIEPLGEGRVILGLEPDDALELGEALAAWARGVRAKRGE